MRFITLFSISLLFIACKQDEEIDDTDQIEILDTQMAQIKSDERISQKEAAEFQVFWDKFRGFLKKNDTSKIIQFSLKNVFCPVYSAEYNYYYPSKLLPLFYFLNAPYKNTYISKFATGIIKDTPKIHVSQLTEHELIKAGFEKTAKVNVYTINFQTKEITGNYKIWKEHNFEFIKLNDSIKFLGLKVEENGSRYDFRNIPFDSLYFPLARENQDQEQNINSLDTFENRWFSQYLKDFKEPILINEFSSSIYRFSWFRSFHNPIVIRIEKSNNEYFIITKELIDYEGYIPQKLKVDLKEKLSVFAWRAFEEKIKKINFWELESSDTNPNQSTDGAQWTLEGVAKGKLGNYHFTTRHSPQDKNYIACCRFLLLLTKLKIKEEDIY